MQHIEPMTLSDLLSRQFTKNPKDHKLDDLIDSFKRFGFTSAPTIDEESGVLVAGHGRALALRKMIELKLPPPRGIDVSPAGDWMVPVVRGLSFANEKERDAYVIADNQLSIGGGWDLDKLLVLLNEQSTFDGLGFSAEELGSFGVGSPFEEEEKPDDDETTVGEHKRKKSRKPGLAFKIVITCENEAQQATLLKRFEEEGLTCQPLIV